MAHDDHNERALATPRPLLGGLLTRVSHPSPLEASPSRSYRRWPALPTPLALGPQPLVLVLALLTWTCGDSQAERLDTAKAACAVCLTKRRSRGRTVQGFHKALARLPRAVLQTVAAGVRQRPQTLFDLAAEGFVVLGCDGSVLECPRSAEREQRLGDRGKEHAAPGVWVAALVQLRTGLLGAWRLGKSTASERLPLKHVLKTLPACALIVAEAGFSGYWLAEAIRAAAASCLIRASGKDFCYAEGPVDRDPSLRRAGLRLAEDCPGEAAAAAPVAADPGAEP